MQDFSDFDGAKLALLCGDKLVSIQRSASADSPVANLWDLPGGNRQAGESPETCVLRGLRQELFLRLNADDLIWKKRHVSGQQGQVVTWFFAAQIPTLDVARLRLSAAGKAWRLIEAQRYLRMSDAPSAMKACVADHLTQDAAPRVQPCGAAV